MWKMILGVRDGESEMGKEEKPIEGCIIKLAPGKRGSAPVEAPEKSSAG